MSKKIRLQTAALLAVILILATLTTPVTVTRAQAQSATATVTADAKRAGVVEATTEVLKETSELRQLPILRPVKSDTQPRLEIERFLIKNIDEHTTPAEMHAIQLPVNKVVLVAQDS